MRFSAAAVACALPLLAAAFEYPEFVPLHKRQAPGTPEYECHANCGGVITLSRTDGFCSTSDFTTKFNACMACALTYDIWQYYGSSVTKAANTCDVDVNLSSSGADASSTAAAAAATTSATSAAAAATTTSAAADTEETTPASSAAPESTAAESASASSTAAVAASSAAAQSSTPVTSSATSVPTTPGASTLATVTPTPTPSVSQFTGAAAAYHKAGGIVGGIVAAVGFVVV